MKIFAALLVVLMAASTSFAGSMDCSVVYDEFDSLMNKNFLVRPQNYVQTETGRMSRNDYNSRQKGKFLLSANHKGHGIAIVHTNRNTWGKLLYTWGAPIQNGQPSLILKEITLYGRVMDGFQPRKINRVNLASSFTLDLDTGAVGAGAASDIWFHNVDGNTMYIEAVNGAEISFPMESLCR